MPECSVTLSSVDIKSVTCFPVYIFNISLPQAVIPFKVTSIIPVPLRSPVCEDCSWSRWAATTPAPPHWGPALPVSVCLTHCCSYSHQESWWNTLQITGGPISSVVQISEGGYNRLLADTCWVYNRPSLTLLLQKGLTSQTFLAVEITEDQSWTSHLTALSKKVQQYLYFLRQLKKRNLPLFIFTMFYTCC